jgi:predicted DNA-binding antitoxin AbrB/MazE fold protein
MVVKSMTVEAIFQNGVLRPAKQLPLKSNQRVTVTVEWPTRETVWPENAAEIYRELADEDKRLAETMWPLVKEVRPIDGERT